MECNFFGISYYVIFFCYVRLKFMSSGIFRTGKTNFIFTFKDTTPCKRLTLIGSSTCWRQSSYFLVPSYCSITLLRLNNPLWMISFTVLRPKDCLCLALEWAATGVLLNLCFILVLCLMFKW